MKNPIKSLFVLAFALVLPLAVATASAYANTDLFSDDGHGISLNDDAAIFHAADQPDAKLYNDGRVRIGDKTLDLSDDQRAEVREYVRELRELRHEAIQVGLNAAHFALDTVWDATIGMLTDGDHAEKRIDKRAHDFEQKVANKICKPVGEVHTASLKLADDVEALQPYLPQAETESKCLKDAMDDDDDS